MAVTCPVCRSDFVQALTGDTYQCLADYTHFEANSGEVVTESFSGSVLPEPIEGAGPTEEGEAPSEDHSQDILEDLPAKPQPEVAVDGEADSVSA